MVDVSPTSPSPIETTPEQRAELRAQIERKLSAWSYRKSSPGRRWRDTGFFDVPGWVLGEMHAEGLIEHRKQSGSSPNEWRR